MRKVCLGVLLVTSGLFCAEKDQISIGVGAFNVLRHTHRTVEAKLEYKPKAEWHTIRPVLGIMATKERALYVYGGFTLEWLFKKHLLFSPDFAAGYYRKGHGKNLGFPLEFRSGVEAGWEFNNHTRIGAHFYHISNAHLGHKNPGEESLECFFSIPF